MLPPLRPPLLPTLLLLLLLSILPPTISQSAGLLITGSCNPGLNGPWLQMSTTASNRYWYAKESGITLYYDPDCSGTSKLPAGWFFDNSGVPLLTAESDLDGDGTCAAQAFVASPSLSPESGAWKVLCEPSSSFITNYLEITHFSLFCAKGHEPVGEQVQNATDPCACDQNGVVDGVNTERGMCRDHGTTSGDVCYVSTLCTTATESTDFPGTSWRTCNPFVDNVLEYNCVPCRPGYYSDVDSPEACTPCSAYKFSTTPGSTDPSTCLSCPTNLSWSSPGSSNCSPHPASCVKLAIKGCENFYETSISGEFQLFHGDCDGATQNRPVYFKVSRAASGAQSRATLASPLNAPFRNAALTCPPFLTPPPLRPSPVRSCSTSTINGTSVALAAPIHSTRSVKLATSLSITPRRRFGAPAA